VNKGDPISSGGACKSQTSLAREDGLTVYRKSDWLIVLRDRESLLQGEATSRIWILLGKHELYPMRGSGLNTK